MYTKISYTKNKKDITNFAVTCFLSIQFKTFLLFFILEAKPVWFQSDQVSKEFRISTQSKLKIVISLFPALFPLDFIGGGGGAVLGMDSWSRMNVQLSCFLGQSVLIILLSYRILTLVNRYFCSAQASFKCSNHADQQCCTDTSQEGTGRRFSISRRRLTLATSPKH